jgi:hypothetical protein
MRRILIWILVRGVMRGILREMLRWGLQKLEPKRFSPLGAVRSVGKKHNSTAQAHKPMSSTRIADLVGYE